MGMIMHDKTKTIRMLPECAVVGRASSCDLRLSAVQVSAEHAALRWTQGRWMLVDLCSRNGTWVGGSRLSSGGSANLSLDTPIGFGSIDEVWRLKDDAPPRPFVRATGRDIEIIDGLIGLPSAEQPLLTIGQSSDGTWFVEDDEGRRSTEDRDIHRVDGMRWRVYLPSELPRTVGTRVSMPVEDTQLLIRHDQTEEHIVAELRAQQGAYVELGSRAHHVLLLELARARLHDRARCIVPAEEGWIHREELSERLKIDVNHVNIMIHRLRRQLAELGVNDGLNMVQRRARSGLLRLGPSQVQVSRL